MDEDEERVARNRPVIEEFRANGGSVAGYEETPLLILTTTGATSGLARHSPVAFLADGDRVVVVGANGGRDRDPAWCRNLAAEPRAQIEVGAETRPVIARFTREDERTELWHRFVTVMPMFEQFEAATDRVIPVVVLEPVI